MTILLTEDQAYSAMYRYLEADYERSPSDGVGALLGAMSLQADGGPADPAARQDWHTAIGAIRNSQVKFELRRSTHTLEATGLHDAILHGLNLDWKAGEVQADLLLVGGIRATLLFHAVSSAVVPRVQPWGPSSSINEAKTLSDGHFAIEMQSGDELRFQAQNWSLHVGASRGEA